MSGEGVLGKVGPKWKQAENGLWFFHRFGPHRMVGHALVGRGDPQGVLGEARHPSHPIPLGEHGPRSVALHDIAAGISRDHRSTFAASSPVTDGKIVVFFYSRGELACFNVDGSARWGRSLHDDYGEFAIQWTPASSPTLFDNKLFIQVLQRDVPVSVWGWAAAGESVSVTWGDDKQIVQAAAKDGQWKVTFPARPARFWTS